jgi:hypothetical protein
MKSVLVASVLFFSLSGFSHSGGTDSYGCHHNRKTGGYHCHNPKNQKKLNKVRLLKRVLIKIFQI